MINSVNIRRIKLIATVLLALVTAAAVPVVPAGAVIQESPFAGGNGTLNSPYLIATADQLDSVRGYTDASFQLVSDISLADYANWEPIDAFSGTLDGRGFTISGMVITAAASPAGLFGRIEPTGAVSNITVANSHISSDHMKTGAVVGLNEGTIDNVQVVSTIVAGPDFTGGVAGMNYGTIIGALVLQSDISGSSSVGGLVGQNWSLIERSRVDDSAVTGQEHTGGAVGYNTESASLHQLSYESSSQYAGVFGGIGATGGIVGTNEGGLWLSRVDGSINGTVNVGGLVGVNAGDIDSVSVRAAVYGYNSVGGLIGLQTDGQVYQAVSNSTVGSPNVYGALLGTGVEGQPQQGNSFSMVYWNSDLLPGVAAVGQYTVGMMGVDELTGEEMTNQQKYEGWNFQSVWYMNEAAGMPELIKPLSGLQASIDGDSLQLHFYPERLSYIVHVPYGTQSVHIAAEKGRPFDSVQIGQLSVLSAEIPLVNGEAHVSVSVNQGSDVYSIEVIALGGAVVDKSMLEYEMATALFLVFSAIEGPGAGQYPEEAFEALGIAIEAAMEVHESQTADQQAVQDAADALWQAIALFNSGVSGPSIAWAQEKVQYDQSVLTVEFDQEITGINNADYFITSLLDISIEYVFPVDATKIRIGLSDKLPEDQPVTLTVLPDALYLADETTNLNLSRTGIMLESQANALRGQILAGDTTTGGNIQLHHIVQFLDAHPTGIEELSMNRQRLIRFALDSIPNKYN